MEEITLSIPGALPESPARSTRNTTESGRPADPLERLARAYQTAARSRDRLAMTERSRRRRHESFELQLKRHIKAVASEAADAVPDRRGRAEVRTRTYGAMMELVRLAAHDQLRTVLRFRRMLRRAFAAGAVGATALLVTLLAADWF